MIRSAANGFLRPLAGPPAQRQGGIGVMRKLLLRCFSLWKNDRPYDPRYHLAHLAE